MTTRIARRSHRGASVHALSVPLMLLAGGMLAFQSHVNGHLAARLGSGPRAGLAAAVISTGIGLLIPLSVIALVPTHRHRLTALIRAVRERRLRAWECSGAVPGAWLVASQGLAEARIGVALFNVSVTAGLACCALLVDCVGLGPNGPKPVNRSRAAAAALSVAAVLLGAGNDWPPTSPGHSYSSRRFRSSREPEHRCSRHSTDG